MKFVSVFFSISLLLAFNSTALESVIAPADSHIIVGFQGQTTQSDLFKFSKIFGLKLKKQLSRSLQIYLLSSSNKSLSQQELRRIKSSPMVRYVQRDHHLSLRTQFPPNALFSKQWSLYQPTEKFDIQAPWAWDFGVGGSNPLGNPIVIGVIDAGFDISHPGLVNNLWVNKLENPENGIDDDGNGYVDDIYGWNSYTHTGNISSSNHGTHVMGIIGSRAPKKEGISGINWQTQMMSVAGSSRKTSVVVESYSYILDMKKLWMKTNGKKGANVVVTNSSFGIDYANCQNGEYPVWNDLYNALGEVGILSIAATINSNNDVDKDGDVPTQCDSPYIIAVTNTTKTGTKFLSAGFGKKSIDLGAPGTQIHSTLPNNSYGDMTGTSMATPHVTGAIALLHQTASIELAKRYQINPKEGALIFKKLLLENVTSQSDLKDKTLTGGRLNLYNSVKAANSWTQ